MENLVCVQDFKIAAIKILEQSVCDFFASGADDEETLRENSLAFKRWLILPRMMRNVSNRSSTTKVLGKEVSFPLGISPMGLQQMAHSDGDLGTAKAASLMGTIFIHSTMSNFSMEEVAAVIPNGRKWFQLYMYKDRKFSTEIIRRAEAAGYEALVLTVDAPLLGKRRANLRNKFKLPPNLRYGNFPKESQASEEGSAFSLNNYANKYFENNLTWTDLEWLRGITKLPIIVKGILTKQDSKLAVENGAAGIFISNHGGRQLDTAPATMDVLQEIVEEVEGKCEIYLDGGVSTGTDIFKAVALGAKMIFAGRPFIWGLALGGEEGVLKVLEIYKEEFDLIMALAGVTSIDEITREYISRKMY